jgi:hypothetical protein
VTRHATIAWFSCSSADDLRRAVPAAAARSLALVEGEDQGAVLIAFFDDEESARVEPEQSGVAVVHVYRVETEWLSPERQPRKARLSRHQGRPLRDVSSAPLTGLDGLAGLLWLMDRASGEGVGLLLFESEESLARGHAYVSDAPPGTAGPATSVGLYDVAFIR